MPTIIDPPETAAFETDDTAVIWATIDDGTRIRLRIPRQYVERVWGVSYSEAAVRGAIREHTDELVAAAERQNDERADGERANAARQ